MSINEHSSPLLPCNAMTHFMKNAPCFQQTKLQVDFHNWSTPLWTEIISLQYIITRMATKCVKSYMLVDGYIIIIASVCGNGQLIT